MLLVFSWLCSNFNRTNHDKNIDKNKTLHWLVFHDSLWLVIDEISLCGHRLDGWSSSTLSRLQNTRETAAWSTELTLPPPLPSDSTCAAGFPHLNLSKWNSNGKFQILYVKSEQQMKKSTYISCFLPANCFSEISLTADLSTSRGNLFPPQTLKITSKRE